MGKFADSFGPKEGAQVAPDPIPHALRDEPVSIASQGMRTTAALKEYTPPKDVVVEPRPSKSGVAGLREDFVESPEKKKADEVEAKVQQETWQQESKEREEAAAKAKKPVAVVAATPATPAHATATPMPESKK